MMFNLGKWILQSQKQPCQPQVCYCLCGELKQLSWLLYITFLLVALR